MEILMKKIDPRLLSPNCLSFITYPVPSNRLCWRAATIHTVTAIDELLVNVLTVVRTQRVKTVTALITHT